TQTSAFRPARKQDGLILFLFDPACDLTEVRGDLLSGQRCFAGKALKVVKNIEAVRVVSFLLELLRDCYSETPAAGITGNEENLAMMSWGRRLIQVDTLFLSTERKSVLASMRDLRVNTRAQRYDNDNAVLHPKTRTHRLLSGIVCLSAKLMLLLL